VRSQRRAPSQRLHRSLQRPWDRIVGDTAGARGDGVRLGHRCGTDTGDTIVVCDTVADHGNGIGSGGVGGGSSAAAGIHLSGSGPVRNRSPGGASGGTQDRPAEAPRPLSNQPDGCGACQRVFEQEEFRAHVTRQACLASGERMARELCVEHLLMPNGTMVDDFQCTVGRSSST
jgi:hypothetical protein